MENSHSTLEEENASVGYQVAATMLANEQSSAWARYAGMVTANSIVLPSIVFSLSLGIDKGSAWLSTIPLGLSCLGLVLCFCWFCSMERRSKVYSCWLASAMMLENIILSNSVKPVSNVHGLLQNGSAIIIKIGKTRGKIVLKGAGKLPMKWNWRGVICGFSLIYIGLFICSALFAVGVLEVPKKETETVNYMKEEIEKRDQQLEKLQSIVKERELAYQRLEDAVNVLKEQQRKYGGPGQ